MAKILAKIAKSEAFVGSAHSAETIKRKARERSHHLIHLPQSPLRTMLLHFCSTMTLSPERRSMGGGANGSAKTPSGTVRLRRLATQPTDRL